MGARVVFGIAMIALFARSAFAADISIGPFCMSGVEERTDSNDVSFSEGVQWQRVYHTYQAPAAGSRAKLVVFSKDVPQEPGAPPDCSQLRASAKAKNIGVILDGLIDTLEMKSRVGLGAAIGNRLWIDPDGSLLLTMKRVSSGLQPVGGGNMQLQGSRLWMRNLGTFLSTPAGVTGTLEIEAYNRSIVGAKVKFPGGATSVATLKQRQPDKGNVVLRVNMATGEALVWRGNFFATKVRVSDGDLALTKSILSEVNMAGDLELGVTDGYMSGLARLEGKAVGFATEQEKFATTAEDVTVALRELRGKVRQSLAAFTFEPVIAAGIAAKSRSGTLFAQREVIAKGPMQATFARVAPAEIRGSFDWDKPTIINLPISVPADKALALKIAMVGPADVVKISGSLKVAAFGLAGARFTRNVALAFQPEDTDATIEIPVDVDTPGVGGDLQLSDYDQKVFLRAELIGFRLKGTLYLDLADLVGASRLEIPPGGLATGLSSTISLQPWLAGTKPGFGKIGVTLSNSEKVTVRKEKSAGGLDIETEVLTIAEPVLRLGDDAAPKRASLYLSAAGKAGFTYFLATSQTVTQKARFEAKNIELKMLDSGGTIDIGGTIVSEPKVSLERLLIDLDRKKDVRVAEADKLVIQGATFSRTRKERSETAFSGNQKNPFSVDRIVGEPEFNDTSITVRAIDASAVSFGLSGASLTLGDSLALRDASITVTADRVRSADEIQQKADGSNETDANGNLVRKRREYFTNLRVNADGKLRESEFSDAMQLDVIPQVSGLSLQATGRSDQLNGSGAFQISAFSGLYKSDLEFQFACKGGSHPKSRAETRFTTGGSVGPLGVAVTNGKFAAEGVMGGLNVAFKSDTAVECDSDSQKHIISPQQEWWTWGICPTWSEPLRKCKWSTIVPEVSFSYHLRFGFYGGAGTAAIAAPVLTMKDGETKFCFIPPVVFNPLVVAMGISPQVEVVNGGGDIEKILNGVIHGGLVLAESGLATGLANTAGLAVGGLVSTPQGAAAACALIRGDIRR